MEKPTTQRVRNPKTGKLITIGGKVYNQLVQEGVLSPGGVNGNTNTVTTIVELLPLKEALPLDIWRILFSMSDVSMYSTYSVLSKGHRERLMGMPLTYLEKWVEYILSHRAKMYTTREVEDETVRTVTISHTASISLFNDRPLKMKGVLIQNAVVVSKDENSRVVTMRGELFSPHLSLPLTNVVTTMKKGRGNRHRDQHQRRKEMERDNARQLLAIWDVIGLSRTITHTPLLLIIARMILQSKERPLLYSHRATHLVRILVKRDPLLNPDPFTVDEISIECASNTQGIMPYANPPLHRPENENPLVEGIRKACSRAGGRQIFRIRDVEGVVHLFSIFHCQWSELSGPERTAESKPVSFEDIIRTSRLPKGEPLKDIDGYNFPILLRELLSSE